MLLRMRRGFPELQPLHAKVSLFRECANQFASCSSNQHIGLWTELLWSLEAEGVIEPADSCLQVLNFNADVFGLKAIRRASWQVWQQCYVLIEQHARETKVQLISKECCGSSARL